jgi:predicted small secreted protein
MKTLSTLLAMAFLIAVAGCNTVEGLGKDVKATGAAVERAAK